MLDTDFMRRVKRINKRLGRAEAKPPGFGLTVKEQDGSPSVAPVNTIKVTNGTLTDDGGGVVSLTTGGGTSLTVKEQDGTPTVTPVTTIKVTNGTLTDDGGGTVSIAIGTGTGTVTSVAQTVPAEFAIAGSPITTSGTLAITKANQNANTVWAGPTSGAAAAPTFRALVAADILDVLQTGASGVLLSHFFNNPNGTASGGQSGLELNQNATGGYTVAPVTPPTTDAIGVLGIASNAASGAASGAVYTSGPGTNNTLCFGGMALDLTWRFRINALPASGQDYIMIIGFGSARTLTPVSGAFMWLDFAAGFTDFRYRTRVASVSSNAGSGLTAAIDTWYKLRIQVDTSSNCIFTIDGANSQTLTGPSGTGAPMIIFAHKERVSGTNNRILYLDYARLAWSGGPA